MLEIRRGGRAVECAGLENRSAGNRAGGSPGIPAYAGQVRRARRACGANPSMITIDAIIFLISGGVAEWLKATVLKTVIPARVS